MTTDNGKTTQTSDPRSPGTPRGKRREDTIEEYGGGAIKARHGRVNWWLLAVYVVLIVWGVYYALKYWGGLGPGLDY